ncbi:restriction endonuclease subunit S [Klebsiella oxytoca]|nr:MULTISPECIES: restriction endonuclease subunit S [Enterobacteriaceae]MCP1693366.1 type I restriction enzyme S subunit [Citrobacter farmeri]MCS6363151.1 restriction endonuclease subunit S [Klebsiella pneumoniae]MCW2423036.1 type I restriction enzyme S subunit [Citrobacter farmeri]WKW02739.1 restriction endonuclease subunit S [Klebsiella oxytoca]WMH91413.1 restriction endonuclease subunit S [Klebsiella oxytoca]
MSGGKLPEGWGKTEIGDIADVISGGTPKSGIAENFASSGEGIAWLTPADLSGYKMKFISHGARDLSTEGYSSCSAKLMPAGAILFSSRAPIGYVAVASNKIATNQGFKSFVFTNDIYPDYAYYYLRNIRHLAEEMGTGTTFKEISGSAAKTLPFVMAPLAEQKIIAEKLDILLAQVDSTKARLEQIPQILKRFRQAVLAAAVNGKLADRLDGNRHWQEQQLSHVASHIVDCPHSTPKWSSEGKYCVRTTAFSPFYLDLSYQGYVDEETYQNRIQRLKPEPDDILYSREGTIGIACQIPKGVELCLGQRMVLIRASDKISSKYLTIVLNSNNILKIVRSKTMGSTAPRINMSDIKSYPIPLPPLQEQHEIVRRVELLFAYADTIEKQVNSALTRVNSLTQSILAKAFRGELTAQWRAENPDLISGENSAAALLEKIKAERAASGGKKTSRKKA